MNPTQIVDRRHLAELLGLDEARLAWLTGASKSMTVPVYKKYTIGDRSGKRRMILAPVRDLAKAQRWILEHVVALAPVHPAAHGFVVGRSIETNALSHAGRALLVNMDVRDFFPSIQFNQVIGVFLRLGYSMPVARCLTLLTTESYRLQSERWTADGPRRLPQGACTSPALANTVCWRLDKRLTAYAGALGCIYTRYADDLSFSTDRADLVAPALIRGVRQILREEHLEAHPRKTRIMRAGARQEVTGLVVNGTEDGAPIRHSRQVRRRLRAMLHRVASGNLDPSVDRALLAAQLRGHVSHQLSVDPGARAIWLPRLTAALQELEGGGAQSLSGRPGDSSLLELCGYRIGLRGKSDKLRQLAILKACWADALGAGVPAAKAARYGERMSPTRVAVLARELARRQHGARRKLRESGGNYAPLVAQYGRDLEFLRAHFDGLDDVRWPRAVRVLTKRR